MIADKKKFLLGLGMMGSFLVVLILFFSPLFNGKNGLEYFDDLYNSISKGSAYYVPQLEEDVRAYSGHTVKMTLTMDGADQAGQTALLFEKAGSSTDVADHTLTVSGDLGAILQSCLEDADAMYLNDGEKLSARYGYDERRVMYNWWTASKEMDRELKKQKDFAAADIVTTTRTKVLETVYNYYGIEPQKISDRFGVVLLSLVFYVIYTVWYGYAIMYLFEGWGIKLGH